MKTALPRVQGIEFRHFEDAADFAGIVAVINATWDHLAVEAHETVEQLTGHYTHATNCDLTKDLLLAASNGRIVGYHRVTWSDEVDTGQRVYWLVGRTHPSHQGTGIAESLLTWSEARLREIGATHDTERPRVLATFLNGAETRRVELLEAHGYEATSYVAQMVRPDLENIPDRELPQPLMIRPISDDMVRAVWEADDLAFRDHPGYTEQTDEDYAEFLDRPTFDPSLWKVAFEGDTIAGQILNFIDTAENGRFGRKRGYTEDITVQRPWRRQGVATALMTESLRELKRRGMEEAGLYVDTAHPGGAAGLYESMGYGVVGMSLDMRKPLA